jgi:cobalt-precorrin 5A hydrolase
MKVAVVSITRHGIALAGKVVAALPGAQLFAPEKFAAEAEAAAARRRALLHGQGRRPGAGAVRRF